MSGQRCEEKRKKGLTLTKRIVRVFKRMKLKLLSEGGSAAEVTF